MTREQQAFGLAYGLVDPGHFNVILGSIGVAGAGWILFRDERSITREEIPS